MGGNPFDFNKNGHMDAHEIAVSTYLVGSTLIGGDGYGPGVEDADNSKQDRTYKSSEESYDFDEDDRYNEDYDDEWLDEDEFEDEDDIFDEDFDDIDDFDYDDYGDLTIALEGVPNAQDLEATRKLASHLQSNADSTEMRAGDCTECAFWTPGETHDTRAWCCDIWYWVQVECGGSIRDIQPSLDKKICPKFQQGTGIPTTCYDCVHWDRSKLEEKRFRACNDWSHVLDDIKQLRRKITKQFGSNIEFKAFDSDYPYEDDRICFDFSLDRSLKPGYGKAQAAKMKDRVTLASLSTKGTYVAGIPFEDRNELWLSAMESDDVAISLQREPENQYDSNAIAVMLNDKIAGYIPAKIAESLAPVMDDGAAVSISDYEIEAKASSKGPESKKVSVQIYLNFNALNSNAHALPKEK